MNLYTTLDAARAALPGAGSAYKTAEGYTPEKPASYREQCEYEHEYNTDGNLRRWELYEYDTAGQLRKWEEYKCGAGGKLLWREECEFVYVYDKEQK